jgi:hypothetical protein
MPAPHRPGRTNRRQASGRAKPPGKHVDRHVAAALAELRLAGAVTGARSQRISVRVDPGVMRAAAARLGLTNSSDVVNASLAVAAAPDRFKAWWAETQATLPDDFELAV